jgi:hypothetical protein
MESKPERASRQRWEDPAGAGRRCALERSVLPSFCLAWTGTAALAIERPPTAVLPIGGDAGAVAVCEKPGTSVPLADWETGRFLVVAFVGTECPLAELYAGRLAELAAAYGPRNVAFLGLAPNRRDSALALGRFAAAHQIGFPILEG